MGNKGAVVHIYLGPTTQKNKEAAVVKDLKGGLHYEIVQFNAVAHPEGVRAMQYANSMLGF
jgi:hypothetical protein